MQMRILGLTFAALIAGSVPALSAKPGGEWAVAGNLAHLRIADCAGRLWGVVSWEMHPGLDRHNPDPSKRNRPMLGVPIVLGMQQEEANRWAGEIYNASDGRVYGGQIRLTSADVLHVEGCFLGLLCGGQDWTRIKDPPGRYSAADAPALTNREICAAAGRYLSRP
jgi:uncharacterized protein (DUF2147 family)